jgi:hypothetical protein
VAVEAIWRDSGIGINAVLLQLSFRARPISGPLRARFKHGNIATISRQAPVNIFTFPATARESIVARAIIVGEGAISEVLRAGRFHVSASRINIALMGSKGALINVNTSPANFFPPRVTHAVECTMIRKGFHVVNLTLGNAVAMWTT